MKNLLFFVLVIVSVSSYAGKDVTSTSISYVYQLDSEDTVFEFQSSVSHNCGSSVYRVKSSNVAVANRKFSLVLTAFISGKKISFHDTEACEGVRSVVAWVKLVN